ncbi:recombination mediator RecR [Porticoccaceae bacterium]|nr:recombination mediator RecR [Porticoccaceae bacterium]MDB2634949.1 recombination mediator RecR [Porticoccaceae bacterium]MDB2664339.1 recombination mediator RecR [Porticoccaceae bacterium]
MYGTVIDQLIDALRCLPGVGAKSAQRMALQLLERDKVGASHLAETISLAVEKIGRCQRCRTLTEFPICDICANKARVSEQICVVENPADLYAIEQAGSYRGQYFVLLGHLSPIDGIGPEELGIDQLIDRLANETVTEVILATNLTVEGEATAHFIAEKAKVLGISVSRIAYGVPMGGELEYVDGGTLNLALQSRKEI